MDAKRVEKLAIRCELVKDVIIGKLSNNEAAEQLKVTPRTIQNYCRRFLDCGPQGLEDRRTGHHKKITPFEEAAIIAFKLARPQRSARLIRDRLHLKVCEEAVRLILAKHRLNGRVSPSDQPDQAWLRNRPGI